MAVNASACAPASRPGPARDDAPWPVYLGTPRHDAAAAESLNPEPRLLWRADLGRAIRGSPALGETVLVVGLAERVVTLVERESGQPYWRRRVTGTIHAGPLLDGDRVYVATEKAGDGLVYALRLRDGRPLWDTRVGSIVAPLALEGDAVYAATEAGAVYRLDAAHGRRVWHQSLAGAVRAAPVVTPAGLVVAATSDTVYLLDKADGRVLARRATPGSVLAAPAFDGERLYAATAGGRVVAWALPDLSAVWEAAAGDAVHGAPALAGDTLYVLARGGTLSLIPKAGPSGARRVTLDIVAVAGPTPTAAGVLVASVGGEVLLVDPATGAVRWRAQVDGPVEEPPLVRGRQVVVTSGRGHIHAYR